MSAQMNERNPLVVTIQLGSPSADDSIIAGAYFYAHRKFIVQSAVLINGASIAASDTDCCAVKLKNGSDVIAELDTRAAHENGLVADVGKAMNIGATEALNTIAAGSTLTVEYDETDSGTAVALTSAVIVLAGWWKESA